MLITIELSYVFQIWLDSVHTCEKCCDAWSDGQLWYIFPRRWSPSWLSRRTTQCTWGHYWRTGCKSRSPISASPRHCRFELIPNCTKPQATHKPWNRGVFEIWWESTKGVLVTFWLPITGTKRLHWHNTPRPQSSHWSITEHDLAMPVFWRISLDQHRRLYSVLEDLTLLDKKIRSWWFMETDDLDYDKESKTWHGSNIIRFCALAASSSAKEKERKQVFVSFYIDNHRRWYGGRRLEFSLRRLMTSIYSRSAGEMYILVGSYF